jgi:hypothetical protein
MLLGFAATEPQESVCVQRFVETQESVCASGEEMIVSLRAHDPRRRYLLVARFPEHVVLYFLIKLYRTMFLRQGFPRTTLMSKATYR